MPGSPLTTFIISLTLQISHHVLLFSFLYLFCLKQEVLELMGCMQKSSNVVKQLNNASNLSTFFGNILDQSLLEHLVPSSYLGHQRCCWAFWTLNKNFSSFAQFIIVQICWDFFFVFMLSNLSYCRQLVATYSSFDESITLHVYRGHDGLVSVVFL